MLAHLIMFDGETLIRTLLMQLGGLFAILGSIMLAGMIIKSRT